MEKTDLEQLLQEALQNKIPYQDYLTQQIAILKYSPGDELELRIRNEDSTESPLALAQRTADMFLRGMLLYPTSIALHPAHLTAIRMQHKDIIAVLHESLLESCPFEGIPNHPIPWESDEGLDLYTCVARFSISREDYTEMMVSAIKKLFGKKEKQL